MKTMPRWSFSTMISSFVHCLLICTSLIAGATIKPTNGGRTIRKDNGNPTGKGPSSPSRPIVVTTQPPTKPPTPAPSPAPTYKPTNPARKPTKSAAQIAAEALANAVLAALEPLTTAVGTKNSGCPYAADDLRRGIFDTTKYQGKAAMYVYSLIQSEMDLTTGNLVLCYVLACIYHATGGPNWSYSDNWLSTTSDPCAWYGVQCYAPSRMMTSLSLVGNGLTFSNSVEELSLSRNGLRGVVPCEIVFLSGEHPSQAATLRRVNFALNPDLNTGGSAGSQWMSVLGIYFNELRISQTRFGTRFPPNLGTKTPNLDTIQAVSAAVTGDLSFLVGLNLRTIELSGNNILGTVPPAIFLNTNLRTLDVSNNQLIGKLPTELLSIDEPANGEQLFDLRLDGNQLTGSLSNFPSSGGLVFSRLLLFDNNLTGTAAGGYCSKVKDKVGVDCTSTDGGAPEVTCLCGGKCCCTRSACFQGNVG